MTDYLQSDETSDERVSDEVPQMIAEGETSQAFKALSNSRLGEYPSQYLEALSDSIRAAHEVNSNSWALKDDGEFLIVFVKNTAVLILSHLVASFIASDPLDPDDAREIEQNQISREYAFPAFNLRSITSEQFIRWFPKYREQHIDVVRLLAGQVKTRVTFNHWHHQHVVEQLGEILGDTLPAPGYFSVDLPSAAGQWRYSIYRDHWATERKDGYISSQGWPNPKIDLREMPSDEKSFSSELQALPDLGPEAARRLWNLAYGMKSGDKVIAHEGSRIRAIGIVGGEYSYHPESPTVTHRRSVTWSEDPLPLTHFPNSPAATRAKKTWGTVPITDVDFMTLTNDTKNDGAAIMDKVDLIQIDPSAVVRQSFEDMGLAYTAAQISTFYTALQTKGFVVLSGISGTGKSKIAQGFVDLLPNPKAANETTSVDSSTRKFLRRVEQYMVIEGRILVPVAFHHLFPPLEVGASIETTARVEDAVGAATIENAPHKGRRSEIVIALDEQLRRRFSNYGVGNRVSIGLQGVGGKIESIEIRSSQKTTEDKKHGGNSLFLAVRPDWRDSTSLLGYYNPLTQTYEWAEFLRFLLRAKESFRQKDGLAWFVILDEMNLAHVEYYFADLLSIIESGRDDEGWSRESIRLTYPDTLTDNAPPHEIKLPPNLYIIGTVNMDETTHAFSPKVLDRAFTIELTDVDFTDYPPITAASGPEMLDEERQALLKAFTRDGTFAQVSKDDIRQAVDDHPEIRLWLQNLNERLAQHQFHFGYRVFDEIAQFIFNADSNGMFDDWYSAFDHAVYMKVLPKFNGSHARLHGPLTALRDWANNPAGSISVPVGGSGEPDEEVLSVPHSGPRLDRVATRAERMLALLEANGFVSFG